MSHVGCLGSIPFDSFDHLILLIPWTDSWTDSTDSVLNSDLSTKKLSKDYAGDIELWNEFWKGHIAQIQL